MTTIARAIVSAEFAAVTMGPATLRARHGFGSCDRVEQATNGDLCGGLPMPSVRLIRNCPNCRLSAKTSLFRHCRSSHDRPPFALRSNRYLESLRALGLQP
jgi:hypothetical protein